MKINPGSQATHLLLSGGFSWRKSQGRISTSFSAQTFRFQPSPDRVLCKLHFTVATTHGQKYKINLMDWILYQHALNQSMQRLEAYAVFCVNTHTSFLRVHSFIFILSITIFVLNAHSENIRNQKHTICWTQKVTITHNYSARKRKRNILCYAMDR